MGARGAGSLPEAQPAAPPSSRSPGRRAAPRHLDERGVFSCCIQELSYRVGPVRHGILAPGVALCGQIDGSCVDGSGASRGGRPQTGGEVGLPEAAAFAAPCPPPLRRLPPHHPHALALHPPGCSGSARKVGRCGDSASSVVRCRIRVKATILSPPGWRWASRKVPYMIRFCAAAVGGREGGRQGSSRGVGRAGGRAGVRSRRRGVGSDRRHSHSRVGDDALLPPCASSAQSIGLPHSPGSWCRVSRCWCRQCAPCRR